MNVIINAKIILKDRIVEGKALVYDDKVRGVIEADKIPDGANIIDAKNGYVAAGLIDLHIHGYNGFDVCDGTVDSITKISEGIVQNGVTGYLPTTMTVSMDVIEKSIECCGSLMEKSKTWNGSQIFGVHAEGPFINPKKKGAQNEAYILAPDAKFVKKYQNQIKIITLAPEKDENFAAIREIVADTDVVVSMGHTDADYETASAAIENGVKSTTHLFNAMTPLGHRAPGVAGAALKHGVYVEVIVDTFHVDKSLYSVIRSCKGDKMVFITDCLPAGGLPEGEFTLGGQKFISKGIECRLPDGTIAGSVLKLNKGVWNAFKNSDIPLYECVNCASLYPATLIGMNKTKGSLEIGKDADVIITDSEFNIQKTIIGGKIRYEV